MSWVAVKELGSLLIRTDFSGIFIGMADASLKKATRRRTSAKERRKVLDIHIEEPDLSVRKIAAKTRMKPSTVRRILSLFKDGKIDRDGFRYESPLWLDGPE